jgi:hypothetical protein
MKWAGIEKMINTYRILIVKSAMWKPLGTSSGRMDNNIKISLRKRA